MQGLFKKVTKRFFIIVNIVFASLFLLACTNSFLPPKNFWFIALLDLFPALLILMIGFLFSGSWFVQNGPFFLLALLCWDGSKYMHSMYSIYLTNSMIRKPKGSIRVITWNVHYLDQMYRPNQQQQSQREPIITFLKQQDADVICLQEFFESDKPQFLANIQFMKKELGTPYHYFVDDYRQPRQLYEVGPVIFSRFPILETGRHEYVHNSLKAVESLISADLNINGDTIRIYTTHLQSVLFRKKELREIEKIKKVEDSLLFASRSIINKLKQAYAFRGGQAELVRTELDACPHPLLVCGDFNDVPNSYTYFHIQGSLQDAFCKRVLE
jgi:endonuclease/exonuclease/phosphatase family metal-dependent hydrolase